MSTLSNQTEFNQLLKDRDRCIILHSLEGEIIGASAKACYELGYEQDEIVQLLLANIKALDLRLSDVCLKHEAEAPIVFQRRNGRRFPAKVSTKISRTTRDRQEQNIVQLEFTILEDTQNDESPLPKFDLQESANYLELLSQEIRRPIINIGIFLDSLKELTPDQSIKDKLHDALANHSQLAELTNDVDDWFKLGINILHLDKQPFNLVSLVDDIVLSIDSKGRQQRCCFSVCIDSCISELVFGDIKRVHQLLHRLLTKAILLHQPDQLRLSLSPHTDSSNKDESQEVAFSLIVHKYGKDQDSDAMLSGPSTSAPNESNLGIIEKLIKIMGGHLKQHRRSDVEYEYSFNLAIPDVDTLDIHSNTKFLSGHKVLLIDNDDSMLKYQLIQWGAEVEFFVNWQKASNYLGQVSKSQKYTLNILQLSKENIPDTIIAELTKVSGLCIYLDHNKQCILDNQGVSCVPLPVRPGLLGNAIARLVEETLPYPYSDSHNARIVDVQDKRPSILFVDDVETIRLTFHALLEKSGYKVDLAQNGIDAILACDQNQYDLIIIDIQMPFMDGIEAASHIRNSKNHNCQTPMLAVSGDISENSRFAVEKVGVQALHPKSGTSDDLLKLVASLVSSPEPVNQSSLDQSQENNSLLKAGRRASESDDTEKSNEHCLNLEQLNNLVADTSLDVCTEMVEIFMQESKQSVAIIDEASHHSGWQQVKNEAHAIKSTSYTFGCEALYHIAAKLETEIERGNYDKSMEMVDDMAAIFSQSYLALEDYFHKAGKSFSPSQGQ